MLIKPGDLQKFRIGQLDVFRQSPQVQEENVNKTRGFVQTIQCSAAQCNAVKCIAQRHEQASIQNVLVAQRHELAGNQIVRKKCGTNRQATRTCLQHSGTNWLETRSCYAARIGKQPERACSIAARIGCGYSGSQPVSSCNGGKKYVFSGSYSHHHQK